MNDAALVSGTANPALADALAWELGVEPLARAVGRFPDGEVWLRLEGSVRDREVIILQPTSPPVNDNLLELLALCDACRREGASGLVAVIPYFGYARSDARSGRREPVMAAVVAEVLQGAGIQRIVTVDPHSQSFEAFFRVPVDVLTAVPSLCEALRPHIPPETVVVSPDMGRLQMASDYAARLGLSVAAVQKRRLSGSEVEAGEVIGVVRDRPCLIIDDMISTGATIVAARNALVQAGARADITVAATHGVFVTDALNALAAAGLRRIVVTDTIAQSGAPSPFEPELQVVAVAPLLAERIRPLIAGNTLDELG